MKKNKIIALILSFCLTLSIIPSISVSAAVKEPTTAVQVVATIPTKPNSNIETSGLKKKAVVYALKYGGKLLGKIVDTIGDKAAGKLLKEHAFEIGEFLDSISDGIEARLIDFMIFNLGFPQSAARIIAWTICAIFL